RAPQGGSRRARAADRGAARSRRVRRGEPPPRRVGARAGRAAGAGDGIAKARGPAAARVPLAEKLRARIEAEGPMRVRDFMEAALYDPEEGYYARGPAIGGQGADFYTASNVSLFPQAL